MYEIEVRIRFRAGHRLLNYNGKCSNFHGEGYTAIIILEEKQIKRSDDITFDFGEVKEDIKKWIDHNWDHAMILHKDDKFVEIYKINNMRVYPLPFNPTAERMAEYLYHRLLNCGYAIKKVGIIESFEDSVAWYYE